MNILSAPGPGASTQASSFAPNQPRPLAIVWAEVLLYAATTIWLFRLIGEILNGAPAESKLIPAIFLAVQLMLIVAALHGRRRLLLACLVLFSVGVLLLDTLQLAIDSRAHRWEPPRMRFNILRITQMGLEVMAFALIFISRRGRHWFNLNRSAKTRHFG